MQENKHPLPHTIAITVYILYIASMLLPPLAIIGVVFAYIFENDAEDFLKSHYNYLIRTFWLALLYFTISGILVPVLVGIPLIILTVIWFIIRIVKGFKEILQYKPITNPKTWKF